MSIAAHPFVTTLVLAAAVASEHGRATAMRTVAVVGLLFVLPLVALTVWQTRRGAWSTVDASHPRERPILFAVGAVGLLALLVYFARTGQGTPFFTGTAGTLVMLALCAAITPWMKVSLHMAAASLAAAVLLRHGLPVGWMLGALLPVLAWSRVALGRHQWSEVTVGLLIGMVTGLVIVGLG